MKIRRPLVLLSASVALASFGGCADEDAMAAVTPYADAGHGHVHDGGMDHPVNADAGAVDMNDGAVVDVSSKAADLRVTLNLLLSEHLIFASKATGAALAGRSSEYMAYGELLNKNGTELGALVGQAFGTAAETQFNGIWSAHNGFFVDYTTGVATSDEAKKTQAVNDLTTVYVPQFSALIAGATGLPEATVAELTTEHVVSTKAIVDAQAAQDWPAAYAAIRAAFHHMAMLGDPLSVAIAGKFPEAFPGNPQAKSVDLRVALNALLQEHLYLASFATGAALGGRSAEFESAGGALNDNGTDIGGAITGLYGADAGTMFNGIWSAHNGFFVDYTTGVATMDEAKKSQAVDDLTSVYVPQFAQFLAGATALPETALAMLTTEHVLETKAVVDAQASGMAEAAADADRHAAQHMKMIGDPLAAAIVAKLPEKF